jgi:hypothetical protein
VRGAGSPEGTTAAAINVSIYTQRLPGHVGFNMSYSMQAAEWSMACRVLDLHVVAVQWQWHVLYTRQLS